MAGFDDSLPMILNRALAAVLPDYRELFARYDLTEQQWRVMRVLWTHGRVTSAELAQRTLLPAPSLVGIVDRLIRKDLVARLRSADDRRVVHVVATPMGRALETEVAPQADAIDARLRAAVTPEAWAAMQGTLETITDAVNQPTAKAG